MLYIGETKVNRNCAATNNSAKALPREGGANALNEAANALSDVL